MNRRVVVTGCGSVSSLGCGVDTVWQNILAGKSGIGKITGFDTTQLRSTICGLVQGYNADAHFSIKEQRKYDPFIQYAILAADEAISQSGVISENLNLDNVGVAIGSGIGGLSYIEENARAMVKSGAKRISPYFIPSTIINMASGMVSIKYGLKGPNVAMVSACTTGSHNIGISMRMIMHGDADVMIVGGSEYASVMLGIGGFSSLRALSTKNDAPEKASRPWDRDRDGFVLSNGAGVLVLESLEHAKARNANILSEVVGFGMSSDAFHMTQPDSMGVGAEKAMQKSLKDAKISPEEIGYINAHATSTPLGDQIEPIAIKRLFKEHAYKLAVSSTKSMLGHMLGAAGAVEAILSIKALQDQVAPPTINCDNPDEGCDLDFVAHQAQPRSFKYAMSNSFGFGGTNACLVFKRFES